MNGASQAIVDGSLLLALPVAVAAGLVSFLSPCVLPLVPGYLGYVTGLTGVDLAQQRRWRMVAGAALFVAGFSVVFLAIGFTAGAFGGWLLQYTDELSRVLGVVTIVMGIAFLGVLPALSRERRMPLRPTAGLLGAPVLGVVFGLGWLPCVGPTLAAISLLSAGTGSGSRGIVLAAAYCLGLGLPFLLVALAFRRAMGALGVMRRHKRAVSIVGGVMLIAVGVLLVTGVWDSLVAQLQGPINSFEPVL